jgi:hypothetical protein
MHARVAQLFKGYLARMANLFPGTWRVDGVTNVSGQHGSHIELRLPPLHSSHSENPYVTKALTRAPGEPFVIHTSMLSRFVVGSVWHNGQLVFLPPLEKKKPIIEPTKALYVSLDSSNKLPPHFPGELLPQSFFPMAATKCKLVSPVHCGFIFSNTLLVSRDFCPLESVFSTSHTSHTRGASPPCFPQN